MKKKKVIIGSIVLLPILLVVLLFTWHNASWQKSTDLSHVTLANLKINAPEETIKQEHKELVPNTEYGIIGLNIIPKHGDFKTWWYKGDLSNQFFSIISYRKKVAAVFLKALNGNEKYIQYMMINGKNFKGKSVSEISAVFGKNYIIRGAEQSETYLQYIDKIHHLNLTFQLDDSKKVVGIVFYNSKFISFTP